MLGPATKTEVFLTLAATALPPHAEACASCGAESVGELEAVYPYVDKNICECDLKRGLMMFASIALSAGPVLGHKKTRLCESATSRQITHKTDYQSATKVNLSYWYIGIT